MEMKCPKCGASSFWKEKAEKGVYICDNKLDTGYSCATIVGAICKYCNTIYPFNCFGKHGDVYECKECSQTNWPLTDYIREFEETNRKLDEIYKRALEFKNFLDQTTGIG